LWWKILEAIGRVNKERLQQLLYEIEHKEDTEGRYAAILRGEILWYFWYTYTWWSRDISAGILCNPAFKPRHHSTKWFLLGFLGMWLNTGITWGLLQQDSSLPLPLKYGF
jgi:hypothetical protein